MYTLHEWCEYLLYQIDYLCNSMEILGNFLQLLIFVELMPGGWNLKRVFPPNDNVHPIVVKTEEYFFLVADG